MANFALNKLEISFETNFIKLKQYVSLGLLDEARKLSNIEVEYKISSFSFICWRN